MRLKFALAACAAMVMCACSGDPSGPGETPVTQPRAPATAGAPQPTAASIGAPRSVAGAAAPVPAGPSGIIEDPATGELIFRTEPITLPAGKESYTCFAATLDKDVAIDGFSKGTQGFVHHIQFNQTLLPEPEGLSECNVLFKLTWMPIFLAGAGASELRLDEGVGHSMSRGTQLLVQLHLLNTGDKDIQQPVEIRMHRSASKNPRPVSPWAIGSSEINVRPKQSGQAQNVCTMTGDAELVAVFPHMHMLGKRLTVEVGKSLGAMNMLYVRDPYDFDDQHMEKMHISLKTGDVLRITCNYMNTGDKAAGFGESTLDEMCFFVGFAVGDFPGSADCPKLWDKLFTL